MPVNPDCKDVLCQHPCFSKEAHFQYGRIHLPVAPACNIQCAYCDRKFDCPNESRPGVTSAILTPEQALLHVEQAVYKDSRLRIAGIAGPGEPLYNEATFQTLVLIKKNFPNLSLCLSTNGLLLVEKLPDILQCGVKTLTVTINAIYQETAQKLYSWVPTGIPSFLEAQKAGVKKAVMAGIVVKINTVLVPGVNEEEIAEIAQSVSSWGAILMNIIPLIPQAAFSDYPKPDFDMLQKHRKTANLFLPQFTHCRQCRADACGVPGEEF